MRHNNLRLWKFSTVFVWLTLDLEGVFQGRGEVKPVEAIDSFIRVLTVDPLALADFDELLRKEELPRFWVNFVSKVNEKFKLKKIYLMKTVATLAVQLVYSLLFDRTPSFLDFQTFLKHFFPPIFRPALPFCLSSPDSLACTDSAVDCNFSR